MATLIYLDTHVALWLYEARFDLVPNPVKLLLETSDMAVSPLVQLELQYLYEVGKISEPGNVIVDRLMDEIGLRRCGLPYPLVVKTAMSIDWTRDPFDRLIVAQASARNLPLVTKDENIREHYNEAVWSD